MTGDELDFMPEEWGEMEASLIELKNGTLDTPTANARPTVLTKSAVDKSMP